MIRGRGIDLLRPAPIVAILLKGDPKFRFGPERALNTIYRQLARDRLCRQPLKLNMTDCYHLLRIAHMNKWEFYDDDAERLRIRRYYQFSGEENLFKRLDYNRKKSIQLFALGDGLVGDRWQRKETAWAMIRRENQLLRDLTEAGEELNRTILRRFGDHMRSLCKPSERGP